MATLPENAGLSTSIDYVSQPSLTWIIDNKTHQVKTMNDTLEAMRQAVEIALSTERFTWQIYDSYYGTSLKGLIGKEYEYIMSELPRRVKDALLIDERIREVQDFAFTKNGDVLTATFTVITVFGPVKESITL